MLPLAAPGLVTAGLLTAFFVWNEFLLAVTLTSSPDAFTVPVSVANFTGSQKFEVPLGTISAASRGHHDPARARGDHLPEADRGGYDHQRGQGLTARRSRSPRAPLAPRSPSRRRADPLRPRLQR